MTESAKKRIKFIINPISGTRDKEYIESYIIKHIKHTDFFFDIDYTEYAQHATIISKEATEKSYDAVIAIGGDGSINEIASSLTQTNTALGIIPNGSGNGLAHYLNIPLNVQRAIKIINDYKIIDVDTATINNKLFVSVAGLGFDALVAEGFAHSKTRGFFSYLKVIIQNYFSYKRGTYTLYYNGKKIEKKVMMITLANSNQFGYNSIIAPDAVINDGLLDVCLIEKVPFMEAPLLSLLLFLRRIDESRRIEIFKTKELTIIQNSKKRVVHIDGDPQIFSKKLHIKVHPKTLKLIVPEKTYDKLCHYDSATN